MRYLILFLSLFLCMGLNAQTVWIDSNCNDGRFVRGDANGDGYLDTTDSNIILNFAFNGIHTGICEYEALDVNDDGVYDITDATNLLQYAFQGTWGPPPSPFGTTLTIADSGHDCTYGNSWCRMGPYEKSDGSQPPRLLGGNSQGNCDLSSVDLTLSGWSPFDPINDPNGDLNWPNTTRSITNLDGCKATDAVFFRAYENPLCYGFERLQNAVATFNVTDTHYTTPQAMERGVMSLFVNFTVSELRFLINHPGSTGTDWCVGETAPDTNLISLGTPKIQLEFEALKNGEVLFYDYSAGAFTGPYSNHTGLEYKRDGGILDFPQSGNNLTYVPSLFNETCITFDPPPAEYHEGYSPCDWLKLRKVYIIVPVRFETGTNLDVLANIDGKTEGVEFEVHLNEVRWEFPNCPTMAPNCAN